SDNSPLGLFVRIGSAHNKLADLYAGGRLAARRVVVDASRVRFQKEFLKTLREDGVEVVLDTEVAELTSPRKFPGHGRFSPWIKPEWHRPFGPDDFRSDSVERLAEKIAEFAVANEITTVLSPTHNLSDRLYPDWLTIDRVMCTSLRQALDRLGGSHIAIDYPVILSNTDLKDVVTRGTLATALVDLPFENLWLRVSGMDGSGGPLKTIQFLTSLNRLHNIGRPIIADYLGGLTGQSAMAFGSVSGLAHGIGEKERFDASDWHLPPVKREDGDEGFGLATRIEIPDLGKAPTKKELEVLAGAPGGRRICACADKRCCPHGLDDMLRDPRAHASFRATAMVQALEEVPIARREQFFLDKPMADTVRTARSVANLRPVQAEAARLGIDTAGLMKRFTEHSYRIDKLASALGAFHERRSGEAAYAKGIKPRKPTTKLLKENRQ
ncbi:MAG: hypothetical protein ABIY37_01230, partial [Devosia sp.]